MTNNWDTSFVLRPDSVTGLRRRTGSYINEFKAALQERLNVEHEYETTDALPQNQHGIHREGSARIFITDSGETDPVNRPKATGGTDIPLDANDHGRLLLSERRALKFWDGDAGTPAWVEVQLSMVGSVVIWPSATIPTNWLACEGQLVAQATYPALYAILGHSFKPPSAPTPASDFYLPDLRGATPMGAGQKTQEDALGDYTVGYAEGGSPVGTMVGDRIQDFSGEIRSLSIFEEYNVMTDPTGIFEYGTQQGGRPRASRQASWSGHTETIQINLAGDDVRTGTFGHGPVVLMKYIIKAL